MTETSGAPPTRDWLAQDSLEVARSLLGATIETHRPDGVVAVRLTEVEAYAGERDPGSHAFRGRTARNAVMFGPPGYLYVYRHLGLHHCVNIVCGPDGTASAVLLRAGEVVSGTDVALARRQAAGTCGSSNDIARGPARLTVALAIDGSDNGADLLDPSGPVRLSAPPHSGAESGDLVEQGPRVGVSGVGGDGLVYPWRFWLRGEPTVSAYRRAPAGRR